MRCFQRCYFITDSAGTADIGNVFKQRFDFRFSTEILHTQMFDFTQIFMQFPAPVRFSKRLKFFKIFLQIFSGLTAFGNRIFQFIIKHGKFGNGTFHAAHKIQTCIIYIREAAQLGL